MQKRNQKPLEDVQINSAAAISSDGSNQNWLRCRITKIVDRSHVEVICVDTGEIRVVANSSLMNLKWDFMEPPPFALECQLAYLKLPPDPMRLQKITELASIFIKSKYTITVKSKSVVKTARTLVHTVLVYFVNKDFKLNFNAILAGLKLAPASSDFIINCFDKIFDTSCNQQIIEVDSIARYSTPTNVQLKMEKKNRCESNFIET